MRGAGDAGSTHVIEVTVVCCVMMVAIVGLPDLFQSRSSHSIIDQMHTTKAHDSLHIWRDMPMSGTSCAVASKLDQLVFQGIRGDHRQWKEIVDAKFGPVWSQDANFFMPTSPIDGVSGNERLRTDTAVPRSM